VLLGHVLLNERRRAAEIWRIRERTEHEAATLFQRLASDLEAAGAHPDLVTLARRCADDERVHAEHCRAIVDALADGLEPLAPMDARLGPADASAARRALYTSVALGCITESLSTALLIELRPHATHDVVRRGLDRILTDEVRHARLGWAHLAYEAERGDVSWLSAVVPAMLEAALDTDVLPQADASHDLRAYGVLRRADVDAICAGTVADTIAPGLARFGVRLS